MADMKFDGELCQVLRSRARQEMLIISKASGLLRGYVLVDPKRFWYEIYESNITGKLQTALKEITGVEFSTTEEYYEWGKKNEANISAQQGWEQAVAWTTASDWSEQTAKLLVRFRDYREIAPGIMWPFREDRVQTMAKRKGKFLCGRTFVDVKEIHLDEDLTDKVNALRPKEGEEIQEVRAGEIVRYKFSKDQTDEEIKKLADIYLEKQKELGRERVRRFKSWEKQREDFEDMVGKPAPILPAKDWINGAPPKLAGKPYLIHFWATQYGPCNNDWPILKQLVEAGATVVGAHPSGTSPEDVSAAIKDAKLPYPTYLSPKDESADSSSIAGYPAKVFPYCVLVDGKGIVVAHGMIADNFLQLPGWTDGDEGSEFAVLKKFRSLVKATDKGFMWEIPKMEETGITGIFSGDDLIERSRIAVEKITAAENSHDI